MNYVLKENFICKQREYGGILVDPQCNEKTFLNKTAFRILQLFDGCNTVKDIVQQLSKEWEVNIDELRDDITEIVTDFKNMGVLVENGDERSKITEYKGAVLDSAAVEVTSRCNLLCKHCILEDYREDPAFDVVCDVIDQLAHMQVFELTLRGGEPFLRPDFCDILQYAQKYMLCTVFTNGTLITDAHIERLQKIQPKLIKVKLDGVTPETHDSIRDQKTFEKTVKTIKKLVKAGLPVEISAILSKFNFCEYTSMIDFFKKLGADALEISEMFPQGRALNYKEYCLSTEESTAFKKYYYEKAITEQGIEIGGEESFGSLKNPFISEDKSLNSDLCPAFRSSVTVKADGNVIPCLSLEKEAFCMGNIYEQPLSEIWNTLDYQALRTLSVRDCEVCSDCIYARICGGGCRARAYLYSQDLKGPPDPVECESKKAMYCSGLNKWRPGMTIEEFYRLADQMKDD